MERSSRGRLKPAFGVRDRSSLRGLGGDGRWKTFLGTPHREATRMPSHPDELLRELEVAEPSLKRLMLRRGTASRARAKKIGVHQRDPFRNRAGDWIGRRIKRVALTDWLRLRFLPWLADHTTRGTRAGHAFWSALKPDERDRLWDILEKFRRERRTALTSLEQRDVAQIAASVYRGLIAARQAWLRDASHKAK